MEKFWEETVRSTPTSITSVWIESTESHVILGGGVAVCLLSSAHLAVIFAIAQLSCISILMQTARDRVTRVLSQHILSFLLTSVQSVQYCEFVMTL